MKNNKKRWAVFWNKKLILGTSISSAVLLFIAGIIFWGGFNTGMEATNKLEFCISCHEMNDNVYQEYKPTIHYANRTGVRAGCPDCHVPKPWIYKMIRKVQASKEVFSWLTGKIDTPEKFEEHRLTMAKSVWKVMKETDSRECRNCHNLQNMNPEFQKPRARKQHMTAIEIGQTCIDCHKGIAHNNVRHMLTDEELEELERPNPEFIRALPELYKQGMENVKATEQKEAQERLEANKLAKAEVQAQIDAAVAQAVASQPKSGRSAAVPVQEESSINVDWSKAGSREITVFYPGTASIEWIHGRDHGGKRAFTKGERCVDCHEAEVAEMGASIVSGESEKDLEPTIIPNKRGSIPLTVDSTHDGEFLYMRFSWKEGKHTPAPFVDGGKMDPDNAVKIAVMLATDEVEYADRAGCWGTCHVDADTMPLQPTNDEYKNSSLAGRAEISNIVTKYIKESRTKVELKGRRGKKLGGWDKLKDESDIEALVDEGKYMDLIRYSVDTKEVEDGSILADRQMHNGQGATTVESTIIAGIRTVIFKRKLVSGEKGDIDLDAANIYNFGFAIHDDYTKSRYHHVSLGYKLAFDNADAEINVIRQ
ncbi:Denitrification system component NirT/cytochrome c552 [Moritella viscosa]|uniref:NapC/NirT family cytochrome c n=1 Tax=Moritella viscosa TaxID=80854 RepID=UPI0009212E05|nr:NapC/NirT family cytochrome c [Moritella viscosa]SHO23837.1 Denitrification system component NirT/cytochrome c552 [Moritella viscosa]